jgi:dipeptidyl aminopeptidase/acylaminoacyl peptidase
MTVIRTLTAATALACLLPAAALAQQTPATFDLTVPNIMRGPEHVGEPPAAVRWTDDARWIYFRWKPGGQPWSEPTALYRVPAAGGEPVRLSAAAADSVGPLIAGGDLSPDERTRVTAYQGDLYLIERRTLKTRRLTETKAVESNPVFSQDGKTVFFLRDNNLFALSLADGALRQLTDLRTGPEPKETKPAGQRKYLVEQQQELFEHIRLQEARREEEDARRQAREAAELKPVYLQQNERTMGLAVDRGGRFAILRIGKPARDARQTMVPDWITSSGFTEPLNIRSKVGDAQLEGRMALLTLATGEVKWLELAPKAAGGNTETAAASTAGANTAAQPTASMYAGQLASTNFLGWNRDGSKGLITALSYDFKDRWIHLLDAATGELSTIAHDHDDAWIAGPCLDACAGWLPDGKAIYFTSERDGHNHLYTVGADGQGLRQLTSGEWEIDHVELAPTRDRFYLSTNEGSPFEQHFFQMGLDGSRRTRITTRAGGHDATPSPEGKRLAVVYSYANQPPELFVMENKAGAPMRQLTTSPTTAWRSFGWVAPEIVHFTARDGASVPARIYRPSDLGAQPNGAAVIFVHGAGYLHNVHNWWSSYYREYMFHHLLAERGYVVLDIDYRGSKGYGRDWRTAIYRHMGGKDLTDQVDGVNYLLAHEGVEAGRVGIYGGSYGGFITLMALFTEQESFGAGAALRAVTDWAHYNHGYTGRILNFPQDDDEAYRRSSPIYFAEGLRAPLLIAHGMVDTNVHFQDVVRLSQRLIELGKTDWEMAVYPVENHGFVEPSSWTDEYRRILELFERHLGRRRAAASEN